MVIGFRACHPVGVPEESLIDDRPTGVFDGATSSHAVTQARTPFATRGTRRRRLWIHHPDNCNQYPRQRGISDDRYLPVHWVHWESLLHSHRTLVELWNDPTDAGVAVC